MKITKIRFKNINSFYGEHPPIDFSVNPLAGTGLFMISGPTGAGKSTLLDVISLALFNRIPRFSAKAQTIKQIDENGSIVNATACEEPKAEAYAEVEYEVKNKQYRSRWAIAKNRNGNWSDNQMEVSSLPDEQIIASKKGDVPSKNEEIIGLNYDQFIQSIVLAQGNFAEFLKAAPKERSKLLEDITGTHIYRQIGEAAYKKNKAAQEEIKNAEKAIESIELLTDDERVAKENQLKIDSEKTKELAENLAYFREQFSEKTTLENAQKGLAETAEAIGLLTKKQLVFQPELEKLEKHNAVADLVKPLADYENLLSNLEKDKKAISGIQEQLDENKDAKKELLQEANELFVTAFSEATFEEELNEKKQVVVTFDKQLEELINEANRVLGEIEETLRNSKDAELKKLNPKSYELNISKLEALLENIGLEKLNVSDADVLKIDDLNAEFETTGNWIKKLEELEKVTKDGKTQSDKIEENKKKQGNYTQELQKTTKTLEIENKKLTILEKKKETESKKVNLEKLRNELVENEPCPLCGSTQHPYKQHVIESLGEIESDLLLQKDEIKKVEKQLNDIKGELKVIENNIKIHEGNRTEFLQQYGKLVADCEPFALTLNLPKETPLAVLEEKLETLKNKRLNISEFIKQKDISEAAKKVIRWSKDNIERKEKYDKLKSEKIGIYIGENITADYANFTKKWTQYQTNFDQYSKQLTTLQSTQKTKSKEVENAFKEIDKLLIDKGLSSIEMAKEQLLSAEKLKQIEAEKQAIQNEKIKLATQKEAFEKQQKTAFEKIKAPEPLTELEIKIKSVSDSQNELLKNIGQVENVLKTDTQNRDKQSKQLRAIEELKKAAKKWAILSSYIGSASGDEFSNFAQSLTLNNLIGLANQRLQHLSDRYVLSKLTSDLTAPLRIIDLYQGNAERSVDTLSGGETFTLSLAMALALSDLASQTVRLDSLFIDEGFGTLDNESLEAAVATLERLQYDSQKTVGIISHRQELIERISTQIRVQKNNDGKSFVNVIG